jgi:DNA invertase Pin-like site-specific DNA recombinase
MCKNVVGYYRTSSTTNVKGDSRTRQSLSVKTYSKKKGWDVVNEFYDVISGTTNILEREEFVKMLSFCENNSIDTILFDGTDRLSRDLVVSELSYEYLTKLGYTLINVRNSKTFTDTSSTGILVRQLLSTISSFEKNNLVEKLRVSRERKSKKNKELGIISRSGNGKCGGKRRLTEIHSNLSHLVLSYKKMKDKRTRKPLSDSKVSTLLKKEHNISISYKTVGRILEDIEMEKRERRNRRRRKTLSPILNVV